MTNCFILLAAGKGKRFKSNNPKQFVNYMNKPLFMHSVDKALKSKLFKLIIIVSNYPIKNISTKTMLEIKRISRLSSLSFIKLLSIKVKNVIKANEIVSIKITMINKFLFNNANII